MTDEQTAAVQRLRPLEKVIEGEESWDEDKLGRSEFARRLTKLVQRQTGPFAISIDGGWGTGKTFFLKRWKKDLERAGHKVIYYDAWQNDFFGDPLLPMIGAIVKETKNKEISENLRKHARTLVYIAGAVLYTRVTGHALPSIPGRNKPGTKYEELAVSRDQVRSALADLSSGTEQTSVVFMVDELDRCRPDFAVATLERIKHVLNAENMMFVFGINRRELNESIKSVYGDINADEYVRRFFDMNFALHSTNNTRFCDHLVEQYNLSASFVEPTKSILRAAGLSLRDIEQCVQGVAFVDANMKDRTPTHHSSTRLIHQRVL